jgi:hypothetical protein
MIALEQHFEGVTAKFLSQVDADSTRSNQHEIGGLVKAGFKQYLGAPETDPVYFAAHMLYLRDDDSPISETSRVSWYNTRANNPDRSAEYRLYYEANPVTLQFQPTDLLVIAKLKNGELLMIAAPASSTQASQLISLFGLAHLNEGFQKHSLPAQEIAFPFLYFLEDLGIPVHPPKRLEDQWLERLIEQFGGVDFPAGAVFSSFAQATAEIDAATSLDDRLMAWMQHEEWIFRIYEEHLVKKKLTIGFGESGTDVEDFIHYSLSVQNRRKARAGSAFEKHLFTLFGQEGIRFEQGSAKKTTENQKKPDFIFPSFEAYHDPHFLTKNLRLLGAKTTCKDRWRQVLSEGQRVTHKHLITLEPAISVNQTDEMQQSQLQLIVPTALQISYTPSQQNWLMSLGDFVAQVKTIQL